MTSPRAAAEQEAWAAYRRLQLRVDTLIARDLERESGLSMADYDVLAALVALFDPDHCIRVGQLTARMDWAHSRLSRQLGRMERRGLISREACELDGRGDDVVLTAAGRRAHDEATPAHLASVHRHFARPLSRDQLLALTGIEQSVRRERDGDPPH
ncbi:MarR family winged helix-turn-helix transcriptional regulator [Streptomyces sp. NBC_00690]|uniref:MarR family winged helix-turn-helix transcriptional regulator n=1 Tax=Streptomyces sp. NBC_00690 TaxID=2975808 RepID=UPI002E2C880F|nr:MarR family winged helix-turn-helix transcriptional regulator [Streptomyces sp. NBC_00690]